MAIPKCTVPLTLPSPRQANPSKLSGGAMETRITRSSVRFPSTRDGSLRRFGHIDLTCELNCCTDSADRAQENGDGIPARSNVFQSSKAPYAPLRQAQGRLPLPALFTGMQVRGGDEGRGEGQGVCNQTRHLPGFSDGLLPASAEDWFAGRHYCRHPRWPATGDQGRTAHPPAMFEYRPDRPRPAELSSCSPH